MAKDPRATKDTFEVSVITPERAVLQGPARFVALPAWDGEVGILKDRAPLIVKLGIGALRVDTPEGQHTFFIDGGFAQMVDNRLSILTEQALKPEDLDRQAAAQALAEAQALPAVGDAAYQERQKAIARARAQLKLAP